jgi:hypothetical protein
MATVQEQAIEWIHQALKFDEPTEQEIVALVPSIPLDLVGMPYCLACESVLCGACGHCHMLDVVLFSQPECPNDHDDMGADCAAWWQAFNAVQTVQHVNEPELPEWARKYTHDRTNTRAVTHLH